MVTKEAAIKLVEDYLEVENSKPNKYVFKLPIYKSRLKRAAVFLLNTYWKFRGREYYMSIDEYIKPNQWEDSVAYEIVIKEYVEDLEICWSIHYCSKQYYETKNSKFGSIGGGPIFVDKETGEMYRTGSAPIDWLESFRNYKKGINIESWPFWMPMDKSQFEKND